MARKTTYDDIMGGSQGGQNSQNTQISQGVRLGAGEPSGVQSPIVTAGNYKQGRSPYAQGEDKTYDNNGNSGSEGESSPIVGAGWAKQGKITADDANNPDNQSVREDGQTVPTSQMPQNSQNTQSARSSSSSSETKKVKSFHDFVSAMEAARQLSPVQEMEMAKRRKRQSVASAIGDGLSALANLYFTTQYAPNVKPQGQLSEKNQARWEKWDKEIKADKKSYSEAIRKAEQAQAELQRKKDKDAVDAEQKRKADERADRKADAAVEYAKAKTAATEEEAKLRAAKAKAIEDGKDGEAKLLQAKIDKLKADTDAAKKRGDAALMNAEANQTRAAKYTGGKGDKSGSSKSDEESWNEFYQIYNTSEGRKFSKSYARNNNLNVGDNDATEGFLGEKSKGRSSTWSDKKNREGMVNAYKAWKKAQQKNSKGKSNKGGSRTGAGSGSKLKKTSSLGL